MEGRIKLGKRLCAWMLSFALLLGFVPGPAQADSNSGTNNPEVWSGSKAISWDGGTLWETGNSIFSSISDGSTILIDTNIVGTIDDDTVKCDIAYKDGDSWKNLVTTNSNGTISYSVTSDTLESIRTNGLRIQGGTFTVSKIRICNTVWTGNEKISWNDTVVPGTQFYTPNGIFSGLAKDDVITVSTTKTGGYDNPQYVVTYQAGDSWTWTDLISISDSNEVVISYTVESEQIASDIAGHGLVFRGQGWTATQITVDKAVWSEAQSFTRVPGTQFETPEGTFTGLAKDNVVKIYTTTTYENPQYVVTYKKGINWDWTDLTTTVENGVISFTVADETMATEIAEHGLVLRGQAWTATKITVEKSGSGNEPVDTVPASTAAGISGTPIWNSTAESGTIGGWLSGYQGTVAASGTDGVVKATMDGNNYYKVVADYYSPVSSFGPVAVNLIHKRSNDASDLKALAGSYTIEWAYKPDGSTWTTVSQTKSPSGINSTLISGDWYCTTVLFDFTTGDLNTLKNLNESRIVPERLELVIEGNNNISDLYFDKVTVGEIEETVPVSSSAIKQEITWSNTGWGQQYNKVYENYENVSQNAGTISVDVLCKSDAKELVEGLTLKATFGFNSQPVTIGNDEHHLWLALDHAQKEIGTMTAVENSDYYKATVTLEAKDFTLSGSEDSTNYNETQLTSYGVSKAELFQKKANKFELTFCGDYSGTTPKSLTAWLDNIKVTVPTAPTIDPDPTLTKFTPVWNGTSGYTGWSYEQTHNTSTDNGALKLSDVALKSNAKTTWEWSDRADLKWSESDRVLDLAGKNHIHLDAHLSAALPEGGDLELSYVIPQSTANDGDAKISGSIMASDMTVTDSTISGAAKKISFDRWLDSPLTLNAESLTFQFYAIGKDYSGTIWVDSISIDNAEKPVVPTHKIRLNIDTGSGVLKKANEEGELKAALGLDSVLHDDNGFYIEVEKNRVKTVTIKYDYGWSKYLQSYKVDTAPLIKVYEDSDQTVTFSDVTEDHTITATYLYSGTKPEIVPPETQTTPIYVNALTENSDGTKTASVTNDSAVSTALTSGTAAGITATEADNVALEAAVVTALAASGNDNAGNNGVVAVITTKSAVVEAPAAMFENAKDGSAAIAVTLKTESKNADNAASDKTISDAVGEGNKSSVKGALDVSLVKKDGGANVNVEVDAAKPITIRTTIADNLDKNQLHVGYIKEGKLVYDDTVQLLDYSKTGGDVSFTTTHYTTFVFVTGDPVWNFNSGLDGWSFGWANDYDGQEKGRSYTDEQKAKMVSLSGGALKLSLDYTKTPSKENPWPSFTVQYYGETIPLSGKNYLSMDVYYDAAKLGGSTLLFAVGAGDNLITADNAQLNTYAATDATINGEKMKKTRVLIGFNSDVAADNNSMNIAIVNTSGTYKGNVYLDNITLGAASNFITTTVNEDYRGTFIPGGRVPMLGDSTTIYVVQKGSDQRIAKLTLDGKTVSDASHKTTYQFTYENDALNHSLYAEFEWFDANGSAGLVVSSGEVFRAELTNPVAAVGEKLVQPEAEVKNGKLATVISEKEISDIIAEVETAEKSEKTDVITIIPYVKDRKTEVTRTEVALPAASVSELAEKTGAALRVETVVAAITIPNESLKEIGSEGGIIAVAAERAEEYMELSVTANGSRLTDIRGGISASVPMECGPGTVAMLAEDELRTRSELVNRSAGHGSEADPAEKDNPTESVEGKPLLYSAANSQGTAMTVLLPGSARIRFVHQAKRFTDVPEVSWASGAVDFVSSHRIFGGYDDGAFYPNSVMNRAMLVQVLYNMSERPAAEHGNVFADVPSGAWFADAVNWASGTRVVRGYGDGTFAPGATITRQDAVVILYRYAGEPECEDTDLSRFEDEDRIGTYARKAIQWAVSRRLLNGVSASQLAPGAELTRYQAAKLLMNYVQDRVG